MRRQFTHSYKDIISLENLLEAWEEFRCGKRSRKDVEEFERNLMDNVIELHRELKEKRYVHSPYHAFNISDPKPRNIHKAHVRDRLLHHAVYRMLYPFFDRTFISDSYSCRIGKGTHRAIDRFRAKAYKASKNHTRTAWVLKCDVKKFFASVDQNILFGILFSYIPDQDILWLLSRIVGSFSSTKAGVGLPLGNLTSQLLVNVYMNEFDQFMKHRLKVKHYIRYADDFSVLHDEKAYLEELIPKIDDFLEEKLRLKLHPNKISIRTLASGVDFLGWMQFPDHRVLRTSTKRRMFKKIKEAEGKKETVRAYLGLAGHGNEARVSERIRGLESP